MLSVEEIRKFIDNDGASVKKQLAKTGVRYYEGEHDILKKRIFFTDGQGNIKEDLLRSNYKIPHPFFNLLAKQQAQYMLSGKESKFNSDIPELQTELDIYFNDNKRFKAQMYKFLLGTIVKGWEFMYAYRDDEGRTAFECADSLGVVEVRARETQDHCDYVIRHYIDRYDDECRAIKRIEVWDSTQTYYYVQVDEGDIELDKDEAFNPKPHTMLKKGKKLYRDDYGEIPFYRLDNNDNQCSDLKLIKALIDDYDVMNVGLSNNIEDTQEALYVVKGFEGDDLDELIENIKAKKHIGVAEDGGVDVQTVDIPVEARKTKMEIDKENIFFFGMGVNTEALKDSGSTVSVQIKTAYYNLDLKCEGLLPNLEEVLLKMLRLVLDEINKKNKTAYAITDVYFNFERETIINEQEKAQIALLQAQEQQTRINTLLSTAMQLGDELTIEQICDVYDLDYDEIKSKLPDPEETDPYALVEEVPGEEGGLIE